MPSEPPNYEAHGVLVLAREIITNGRTIHFRDIRDIRIQRYGPSMLTWFAMGMLLVLAGAAVVYGFAILAGEALVLLLLGGSGAFLLGEGIVLALSLRRKALVIVTPNGEVAVAFAGRARA